MAPAHMAWWVDTAPTLAQPRRLSDRPSHVIAVLVRSGAVRAMRRCMSLPGPCRAGRLLSAFGGARGMDAALRDVWDMVGLAELMRRLARDTKFEWLFKQVVWEVGMVVDNCLQRHAHDQVKAANTGDLTPAQMDKQLVQYYLKQIEDFAGQRFLSVSLDASTVGQKKTFVGVLAQPNNRACVVPPQALIGQHPGSIRGQ